MRKQVHVYYSGRVHGVGFRFTVQDLANDLGIRGWVKNLTDGRVRVVAEAEEGVLKDFLAKIKESLFHYIQDIDVEWQPATAEFEGFQIRF